MNNENKSLLLQDLSARLLYGVKCYPIITNGKPYTIGGYRKVLDDFYVEVVGRWVPISTIKPYLRPLSSMTEKERKEYNEYLFHGASIGLMSNTETAYELIDWLNAHHFDYRGLIEKGLAIEAPEDMY